MREILNDEDLLARALFGNAIVYTGNDNQKWYIKMLEKLKVILEKVLPDVDMSSVNEGTKLIDDLGFDSLAIMMMSMEIEDAFGFKFTEFVRFETVGDVCSYLESKGL